MLIPTLLWACAGRAPAPPASVDVAAVLAREGLADDSSGGPADARVILVTRAELGEGSPAELLVAHTVPDAASTLGLSVFRVQDAAATRAGAPWTTDGGLGRPHPQVIDVDGDGRDEVLLTAPARPGEPAPLHLLQWGGTGFEDRVWSTSPGQAVLAIDVDADGVLELVGLTPPERPDGAVRVRALARADDGSYRPATGLAVGGWLLQPLLQSLTAPPETPLPPSAPLLLAVAVETGLRVPDAAALQPQLEARYRGLRDVDQRGVVVDAMRWAGDPGAIFFLIGELGRDAPDRPLRAIGRGLGHLGGPGMLVETLDADLSEGRYRPELFLGALDSLGAPALLSLSRDRAVDSAVRARMVADLFPHDPAFSLVVRDLVKNPDPALMRASAQVLEQATRPDAPDRAQWLALFSAEDLVWPLRSDEIAVREHVVRFLTRKGGEPAAAALLAVALDDGAAEVRSLALAGLLDASVVQPPGPLLARLAADPPPAERPALVTLAARGASSADLAALVPRLDGPDDLGVLAGVFADRKHGRHGTPLPLWLPPEPDAPPDAQAVPDPDTAALVSALIQVAEQNARPALAEAAARALGQIPLPEAHGALQAIVDDHWQTDRPAERRPVELGAASPVQVAAVEALGAQARAEDHERLIAVYDQVLADPAASPALRTAAVSALVRVGDTPARERIDAALAAGGGLAAQVTAALVATEQIDALRAHTKVLLRAPTTDCDRTSAALVALVRAGDGATEDLVSELFAQCPDTVSAWLPGLMSAWAAEPLFHSLIVPYRDHPDRSVRLAAEAALAQARAVRADSAP